MDAFGLYNMFSDWRGRITPQSIATTIVIGIIVAVIFYSIYEVAHIHNYANGSYVSRPGNPYVLDPSAQEGSFLASEQGAYTGVTAWTGCSGPSCWIRDKTQPRTHVYNDAASWYVYGPQIPPIVAWLRQQQIVNNADAINTYLDSAIAGQQAPWGPRNNFMRNRR